MFCKCFSQKKATRQKVPGFLHFDSTDCGHSFNIQQLIKGTASSLDTAVHL